MFVFDGRIGSLIGDYTFFAKLDISRKAIKGFSASFAHNYKSPRNSILEQSSAQLSGYQALNPPSVKIF